MLNGVRNPNGIFINTSLFREPALHFKKYGCYTKELPGSYGFREYWQEELKRCKEGYSVGGVRITGNHYFYLNYIKIQLVSDFTGNTAANKTEDFPDFWDGDYNYFWMLEVARKGMSREEFNGLGLALQVKDENLTGGHHMIVGKARRKGYSYKNGAICANIYNHTPKSLTIIGAYDKKYLYPEGTMGMAANYLNHINEHTAWGKNRLIDKQEHKKSGYEIDRDGIKIEKGYKSQIMALSFGENPDVARGKDAAMVLFEEAGRFPNLQASYMATEPTLKAGRFITGQIIIFGTGGDMEGGTIDFANMFYNPDIFNLMQFTNIWDENAETTQCGFFHPFFYNLEGFYDSQGNSQIKKALDYENTEREKLKTSSTGASVLDARVQEYSKSPSEAFLTVSTNNFPTTELRNRLNLIKREKINEMSGTPCFLYREAGKVKVKIDMDNILKPIWHYKISNRTEIAGSVIIFEAPITNPPRGLYKIGYDPYRQDIGTSMSAIYVYKGVERGGTTNQRIVAMYVGRPDKADDVNEIFEKLIELYNTEGMYENEVTHVKTYFERRKKTHLLALQPDTVIKAAVKNSKVQRMFGCHMNEQMKDSGEKYIKEWLLTIIGYDEYGQPVTIIDTIDDPGLLEELILYNRKGNFDRVMALMQVMFQCQEEELGKEYGGQDEYEKAKEEMAAFEMNLFN
jgi:hypothetical protein